MSRILLAMVFFSQFAWAGAVTNMMELALLPPYCKGTQVIRQLSNDPTPISQYVEIYGHSFYHLHHYCWALNAENKANMMSDKSIRGGELYNALGDIKYVLVNADPDFILLPEIYNSQARILFSLHRDGEAVIALEKAIELKPGYVPAVARLSDYYVKIGDNAKAIKTLKTGIDNTENAGGLIKKLAKLGITYQGTPGSAIMKEEQIKEATSAPAVNPDTKDTSSVSNNVAAPVTTGDAIPPVQTDRKPANSQYCRFCP